MALSDKIISFWKRVKLKSSDMFTLFRVGIGVKVPTNKLHIKDSKDPLKIEGLQNDTTDPDKYLTIDSSNIVKYRTGAEVLSDVIGSSTDFTMGDLTVDTIIFTGEDITTANDDFNITLDSGNAHSDSIFSINADNPLNFLFRIAEGAPTTYSFKRDTDAVLISDGNMTFRIDGDADETGQSFAWQNNSSTEIASLTEAGNLKINGDLLVSGNDIKDDDGTTCITFDSSGNTTIAGTTSGTFSGNLSGTASGLSATLAVSSGGTGATTLATNSLLTGNGTSPVHAAAGLTYDSDTLTIGDDDIGTAIIERQTHSDDHGGHLHIKAGDGTGSNKNGGHLSLYAGTGTGNSSSGYIRFYTHAGHAGTATDPGTPVEVAQIDDSGNLQIDGDLTVSGNDIKDSGGNSIISSDGSGVVTMPGGNINIDGSNSNFNFNNGADIVLGADTAGGTSSTIMYLDSGSSGRYMLMAEATDKVVLCNRASNGTVYIRANTSTAGAGGEVTVATFEDDKVTISQDLDVTGNVLPGITYVKILPSDFMPDDGGRPAMIDDTSGDRWLESNSTNPLYAFVEIPQGFKATHVDVYGNGTSAVTVYEADVNSATVTSKGTGNIGTQINITDVTADATNYIMIELAQASGEKVYGGKMTIAKA